MFPLKRPYTLLNVVGCTIVPKLFLLFSTVQCCFITVENKTEIFRLSLHVPEESDLK